MVWRKLSLLFYPLVIVIVLLADLGDPAQWNNGRLGPVRIDLLVHLFLFLPWALLARHMWAPAFSSGPFSSYVILMLIGFLLAVSLESAQYFLSYRIFSWEDMGINIGGLVVGSFFRFRATTF
jgi:VanZ family protein